MTQVYSQIDIRRPFQSGVPQMRFRIQSVGFLSNVDFLEPFVKVSPYSLEGKPVFGFVHNQDLSKLLGFLKNGSICRLPVRWSLDFDNEPWTCGHLERAFVDATYFTFTPDPNIIFDEAYDSGGEDSEYDSDASLTSMCSIESGCLGMGDV